MFFRVSWRPALQLVSATCWACGTTCSTAPTSCTGWTSRPTRGSTTTGATPTWTTPPAKGSMRYQRDAVCTQEQAEWIRPDLIFSCPCRTSSVSVWSPKRPPSPSWTTRDRVWSLQTTLGRTWSRWGLVCRLLQPPAGLFFHWLKIFRSFMAPWRLMSLLNDHF